MTTLHIVTGDKGNVGKSAWCMAMIEYYRHHERSLELVDADRDSQTLSKVYESAFPIMLSDDIAYAPLADSIYEIAYAEAKKRSQGGDVLVDLPAGGEKFINNWIDDCGITERAEEDKITIVKWWVSDSDSRSIQLFEKDVERYPTIQYVFLKNMGRSSPPQWSSFDGNEVIKALVKQGRISIFELPGIPSAILDELRVANAKLSDVLKDEKYKQFGLSKGMRVRGWVTNTGHLIDAAMPININKKRKARKKRVSASQIKGSATENTEIESTEAPVADQVTASATA
ncbi:MAG: hypothetical protein HLUCCA11_21255 [Phormidesmis priestleyi Ana]|uniref:CobQ/CobB/MinD/ParA nucleotide binding domain n=1 Tax=Phormidesmis priestleyi Ana TaxID=1666911 RepID=A0A0P7ZID1_9CYAN|nr:MAG: hypothetical protein HLUCCA11_21255 [Phormidesmis priestleyi Ana]